MRVLICGGRQFEDAGFLWQAMHALRAETPGGIAEVIAGDAVLNGRVMDMATFEALRGDLAAPLPEPCAGRKAARGLLPSEHDEAARSMLP